MRFLRPLFIIASFVAVNKVSLVLAMPVTTDTTTSDCNCHSDRKTPDLACGTKIEAWHARRSAKPEERKENCEEACMSYTEGDMIVGSSSSTALRVSLYNALDPAYYPQWPNKIPYVFNASISDTQKTLIIFALNTMVSAVGCMSFVARTNETDYIVFGNTPTGCWSNLGRQGGPQIVNLQYPGCTLTVGTPMHEVMHALGFLHEQTRPDRNNYVNVMWPNIIPGAEPNFQFLNVNITYFNAGYDYGSVMHYSQYAFTVNGEKTLVPSQATTALIGQRIQLSTLDIKRLKTYFGCYSGP